MCALSAVSVVTSGRIQSVKADLQVTDRFDGRQVQCTARAQLRNGRVQVLQGIEKKVLLFFLSSARFTTRISLSQNNCQLFFNFSISQCSIF